MNRFKELRKEKSLTVESIAKTIGIDEATLFLFELHAGHIHIDIALSLCSYMDISFFELFPDLNDLSPGENEEGEDEMSVVLDLMRNVENRVRFYANGIDPDSRNWFVLLRLRSGVERRYRLNSPEKQYLEEMLTSEDTSNPFIVFTGDCRTIILKRNAVLDVRFSNAMSYAQFSSLESAYSALIVYENMQVPKSFPLTCDDLSEQGHGQPLGALIQKAREGGPLPSYLRFPDDEDECLINIETFELMEIPVGATIPFLYMDDLELEDMAIEENSLSLMEPQGTA